MAIRNLTFGVDANGKPIPLVIENCPIMFDDADGVGGRVFYTAKMAIDGDGLGPSHGDSDYQPQTSLKLDGISLNADVDHYIVVPPQIIKAVKGIVLGCRALVYNRINKKITDAVVGDVGPHSKLGEASIATAAALGVPSSPTTGGDSSHVYEYCLWPGQPAVVGSKHYVLQPTL